MNSSNKKVPCPRGAPGGPGCSPLLVQHVFHFGTCPTPRVTTLWVRDSSNIANVLDQCWVALGFLKKATHWQVTHLRGC